MTDSDLPIFPVFPTRLVTPDERSVGVYIRPIRGGLAGLSAAQRVADTSRVLFRFPPTFSSGSRFVGPVDGAGEAYGVFSHYVATLAALAGRQRLAVGFPMTRQQERIHEVV